MFKCQYFYTKGKINYMSDELEIIVSTQLEVDKQKSITQINSDIKKIEEKLRKLKLTATLDNVKSKTEIQKEIETLNKQRKKLYVDLQLRKDSLKKQYKEIEKESNFTLSVNTSNAEKSIRNVSNTITSTTNESITLGLALKNAFSNAGLIMTSQRALSVVRRAINEVTQAVKEYNEYTKNLKIISNKDDVSDLIAGYATKSIDMKVDISEYEQASEVILRAGKNLAESAEYTETAIKLAKTGFIETDTAAENLVVIANSYDLTADKLKNVTDALLTLDVQSNTEAGALSSAMAKSAKNAQLCGLSYEQLGATIAKLRDTTGKSEAEIATSLNNIFNRTYRVKPNAFTFENENGETEDLSKPLSDVEKVVNQLGISIRKSATEFKDFEEIISTIAPIWKDLDSVSQNAISSVFAGQHKNVFLNLVNDWQDIVELTKTAENSLNATEQKYEAYLGSIQAKSAEFSTTTKEMWNHLIPKNFIGDITEAGTSLIRFTDNYQILQSAIKSATFYALAKGAITAKNSLVGITTDLKNISTAFSQLEAVQKSSLGTAEYANNINALGKTVGTLTDKQAKLVLSTKSLSNSQRIAILNAAGLEDAEAEQRLATLGITQANQQATTATFSLSGAFKSLWATIAANPVMSLTIAFTAVSTIITTIKQKQEEYRQSIKDTANETKEFADNLNSLYNAYSDLKTGVENGTASKEDLTEATNKLLEALGYEGQAVDDLIAKYGDLHTAINQATADRLKESLPDLANAVDVELDELTHKANIQASMSFTIDKNDANKKITDFLNDFTSKNNTEFIKITNSIYNENSAPFVTDIGKEYSFIQIFNNDLDNSVEGIKKRLDELNLLKQSLFDYFGAEDVQSVDLYKTVNKQIANLSASYDEYTTALSDYNNTAAEAQIVQSLVGKEIPKTVEEYKKYRSELIKSANDSKEYIGSQEDIINSIDGTLSKMSEFADVQNRLNNIETAKDKFVVGKVNSKPISDFIDALSNDDLSILIQLDTNIFDNGIDGVSQAIEDFKNNSDNQISVDVETSEIDTSSLEKLQEAYDNLSKSAESYTKAQKTLTDAIKQQEEHGQLSAESIKNLTEAGYAQALTINNETGAVTLNTEAYNRLNEQKKQKLKLDLD